MYIIFCQSVSSAPDHYTHSPVLCDYPLPPRILEPLPAGRLAPLNPRPLEPLGLLLCPMLSALCVIVKPQHRSISKRALYCERYALCAWRFFRGEGNGFPLIRGTQSVKKRKSLPFLNIAKNQQNWKIVKKQ